MCASGYVYVYLCVFVLRHILTILFPRSPGEFGSSSLLTVASCISPCYNEPNRFSSELRTNYDLLLLLRLKSVLIRHAKALSSTLDVDKALSSWTFGDFHQAIFGPLYGHKCADEFWEANDCTRDVDDISVPLLCVNSADDPVCQSCSDIPYDLFKCYPNFMLMNTQNGGHCGFWEGFPPKSWVDVLALDYVEAVVEFMTKPPHHHAAIISNSLYTSGGSKSNSNSNSNSNDSIASISSMSGFRRTSFNRSYSSCSRGSSHSYSYGNSSLTNRHNSNNNCSNSSSLKHGGSSNSTKTSLKRCRFTI